MSETGANCWKVQTLVLDTWKDFAIVTYEKDVVREVLDAIFCKAKKRIMAGMYTETDENGEG